MISVNRFHQAILLSQLVGYPTQSFSVSSVLHSACCSFTFFFSLSQQDRQNHAAVSVKNVFSWMLVFDYAAALVQSFISSSIHMFLFGKTFDGFSFPEQNCSFPYCCVIPSLHGQSCSAHKQPSCCLLHSFSWFYKYYFKRFGKVCFFSVSRYYNICINTLTYFFSLQWWRLQGLVLPK